jgi:hypothetical protein
MKSFVDGLGRGSFQAPKGQDPKLVVNMRRVRIPDMEETLSKALDTAREYVTRTRARQAVEADGKIEINRQLQQSD